MTPRPHILHFGGFLLLAALFVLVAVASRKLSPPLAQPQPLTTAVPGDLASYPRPPADTGRGIHWFPNPRQSRAVVNRFMPELHAMGIKWVVVLGFPGFTPESPFVPLNEYAIRALIQNGIEPVLRTFAPVGPIPRGNFLAYVRFYRALGVRYFQLFNEPNRWDEWANPSQLSPQVYVEYWLPLANLVVQYGGYPGLGGLDAQTRIYFDDAFLRDTLLVLRQRAPPQLLARTWIALHNYTSGQPADYLNDVEGFRRFAVYNRLVTSILGHSLPILGTEGVLTSGDPRWRQDPKGTAQRQGEWVSQGYRFMEQAPPYFFVFSPWLLGNGLGGGPDPRWEVGAFFREVGGPQPVVEQVGRPFYLVRGETRHWVADLETARLLGYDPSEVREVPAQELRGQRGPPIPLLREGSLVKGTADPIYRLEKGLRRRIPDVPTFVALGYRWDEVLELPDWALERLPLGPSLLSVKARPGNAVPGAPPQTTSQAPPPPPDGYLIRLRR